jgi:hypothetical protein
MISLARSLALAACTVAAAVAIVPKRALCGDAVLYTQLITGGVDVEAPFRFRVVVPWLARILPLAPAGALAAISYASLLASYTLVLLCALRLRLGFAAAALGLAAAVLSPVHLYAYHNPYLTDCLALAVSCTCLYALLNGRFGLFGAASAVGMGVRESLIFAAMGWSPCRLRAAACVLLALASHVLIRLAVGPSAQPDEGPFALFPAHPPGELVRAALGSWHVIWVLAPLGLSFAGPGRGRVVGMALPALLGACGTALLAADTERMFQPLFPFAALGAGRFAEGSWQAGRSAGRTLLARLRMRSEGQGA